MKQVFNISFPEKEIVQPALALQIGEKHLAFAITGNNPGELKELNYYSLTPADEAGLPSLFSAHPQLDQLFHRVRIGYQLSQATLLPAGFGESQENSAILKAMAGPRTARTTVTEAVPGWQLDIAYAVPARIYERLHAKYVSVQYWHEYAVTLRSAAESRNDIYVDFRQVDFSVILVREKRLLFAGNFEYSNPADVLYALLRLVLVYELSPREARLFLSGLIDNESALYSELLQYFLAITFRNCDWPTGYPAHYFTSLNDLARCE